MGTSLVTCGAMYCAACREERSGTAKNCVVCGGPMTDRTRGEVEDDLRHVQFILADLLRWDEKRVGEDALKYLRDRYLRQERVLLWVLHGEPEQPVQPAPAVVAVPPEPEPIVDALPVDAEVVPLRAQPSPAVAPEPAPALVPAPAPEPQPALVASAAAATEALPSEAFLDIPEPDSKEKEIVEEVSTWHKVWKPFLYESVPWFIGAFLIIAGSFYFVALGWSGFTDVGKSLTVFGFAAVYSGAFFGFGALLARRPGMAGAGRVLGLIGAAMAPFAGLALAPALDEHPVWVSLAAIAWAALAALWTRRPASLADVRSARWVQASVLLGTVGLAVAPKIAALGPGSLWLNGALIALAYGAARGDPAARRTPGEVAFALLAPAYVLVLFAVRLHLSLDQLGTAPVLGAYAPFISALAAAWLQARAVQSERAADPVSISVVALEAMCVVLAAFGPPPSFFVTSAILTGTAIALARGGVAAVRWYYPAYAAAYLAYQSVGQLVPGWLDRLIQAVKLALGYLPTAPLPFNFAAVYAVPFVIAGAVLAVRLLARGRHEPEGRAAVTAEVLLRATGAATLFFSFEAIGRDARPVIWGTPALAALCVVLGLWLDRRYLTIIGAVASAFAPVALLAGHGPAVAALYAGAVALLLAIVPHVIPSREKHGLAWGSLAHTLLAAAFAWGSAFDGKESLATIAALALAAGAAVLLRARFPEGWLSVWAGVLGISVLPHACMVYRPSVEVVALAASALLAAALAWRRRDVPLAVTAVVGSTIAALAAVDGPWLGPVLLAGIASASLAALLAPWLWAVAAMFVGASLFPHVASVAPWDFLSPAGSAALSAALALGASAWTVWRGRSVATVSFAIAAVLAALVAASAGAASANAVSTPELLIGALAILLASQALLADLCIPLAATVVLVHAGGGESWERIALALALTALAALDELPALREKLLSRRPVALSAALSAACVLGLEAVVPLFNGGAERFALSLAFVVACAIAGVLWVRFNRAPVLLMVAVVLGAARVWAGSAPSWLMWIPVATAVVPSRLARVSEKAARWLGVEDASRVAQLGNSITAALAGGIFFATQVHHGSLWPSLAPWAAGALAIAGGPAWVRLALFAVPGAIVPELRDVAILVLLGIGVLALHRPALLSKLLGADESRWTRVAASVLAICLSLVAWERDDRLLPTLLMTPLAFAAAAVILEQRWLLWPAIAAAAVGIGWVAKPQGWESDFGFILVTLVAALLAAALRSTRAREAVARVLGRISPKMSPELDAPLWAAAAAHVAISVVAVFAHPAPLDATVWMFLAASLALLVATREYEIPAAGALAALALIACFPQQGWGVAAAATMAALLTAVGRFGQKRLETWKLFLMTGWIAALLIQTFTPSLGARALPVSVAMGCAAVWLAVAGERRLEPFGWAATWAAAHAVMLHLGVVYSTGRGGEYVLPYLGAISALIASAALLAPPSAERKWVSYAAVAISFLEIGGGIVLMSPGAAQEGAVAAIGLAVLFGALVRSALRRSDPVPAYLAQGALLLAYLALRVDVLPFDRLDGRDGFAGLIAGAVFSGLHAWAQREASLRAGFEGPARLGAFLFPIVGALAAPWNQPWIAAALLVGDAAHFAAFARQGSRRTASILAFAAFNVALYFAWNAAGAGEPQYYVIPAGIAALVLVRVFRQDLTPPVEARLRAASVTIIYAASAWKPLMFSEAWAMIACAAVCLVGVAVGIALRIRSFVYLGTAFLVTSVVANLVRFGVREPQMGALFLSLLGVLVVAVMVLFTAKRAELVRRYEAMRELMGRWNA